MVNQSNDFSSENLAGLEAALRDAADRSMKSSMPLALALQFYRSVVGLARCLRMVRKDAGLPRGLSPELIALLGAVRASASKRLAEPGHDDVMVLRLVRSIEGLMRAVLLALPVPEKPRKTSRTGPLRPETPPPAVDAAPTPPAVPWHRDDELTNRGFPGIQALKAEVWATGDQPAAHATPG